LPWIVTAVIGDSILTEFLMRKRPGDEAPEPLYDNEKSAPIDDLDDLDSEGTNLDGPIYRDEGDA